MVIGVWETYHFGTFMSIHILYIHMNHASKKRKSQTCEQEHNRDKKWSG